MTSLLEEFCGRPLAAYPPVGHKRPELQYVVDTLNFMQTEGIPLPPSITPEIRWDGKVLALNTMLNASAYLNCSAYPRALLEEVQEAMSEFRGTRSKLYEKPLPKFLIDVSSREMFYSLTHKHIYGFQFKIPGQPEGLIVPGTSIFWEMHVPDDSEGTPYIKASYQFPTDAGVMSERQPLRIQDCPEECPVDQFIAIHESILSRLVCTSDMKKVVVWSGGPTAAPYSGLAEDAGKGSFWQGAGFVLVVASFALLGSAVAIRRVSVALWRNPVQGRYDEYVTLG